MKVKKLILPLILVIVITVAATGLYTVAENEYACVVRFSKIIATTNQAGLHLKVPFLDSVKIFPKARMLYDIQPSEVLTADKQNMTVDSYVVWRISDPLLFYQTLGTLRVAEERLDTITYTAFKNLMGRLYQTDIISDEGGGGQRNDLYANVTQTVASDAKTYGISVEDVKIKRFDLPSSNEQAVYTRMISERNQMAEKYIADGQYEASIIRNSVDKQVNIIVSNARAQAAKLEAEGEQEYMRMLAQSYNSDDKRDFYEFMLALDALKTSLGGEQKTVILGKDSALAKILTTP